MAKNSGDSPASKRRRILIESAAIGGVAASASGLPFQWKKPLVEIVSLPAHAMTTPVISCSATTLIPVEGTASLPANEIAVVVSGQLLNVLPASNIPITITATDGVVNIGPEVVNTDGLGEFGPVQMNSFNTCSGGFSGTQFNSSGTIDVTVSGGGASNTCSVSFTKTQQCPD